MRRSDVERSGGSEGRREARGGRGEFKYLLGEARALDKELKALLANDGFAEEHKDIRAALRSARAAYARVCVTCGFDMFGTYVWTYADTYADRTQPDEAGTTPLPTTG